MSDRRPSDVFDSRLGALLRTYGDEAIGPFDGHEIARMAVARGAIGTGWRRWLRGLSLAGERRTLVVLVVLAVGVVGGALLVGSLLAEPAPMPTYRLGHLAYELNGDIWIADWDGSNAAQVVDGTPAGTPDGWHYSSPQWSRDGGTLSFFGHDGAGPMVFYQADGDGRGVHEVGRDAYEAVPIVSPTGGQRLLYRFGGLTIIDNDGVSIDVPAPAGFVSFNYWVDRVSWTPDGSRIIAGACTISDCKSASGHALFSVPLSGALPTRLTPGDVHDWYASVSPDGAMVAFSSWEGYLLDAPLAVGLMRIDGTDRRIVPGLVNINVPLLWSPDSQRFAVTQDGTGVWIVSLDPEHPPRLLDGTDHMIHVVGWSPDGQSLLVVGQAGPGAALADSRALWSIEVDGDGRHRLVTGTLEGDWQWVPTDALSSSAQP